MLEIKEQRLKIKHKMMLKNLKNFSEVKNKPKSKPKSLFLSFTTLLGIFRVTLIVLVLPAVAKDLPKKKAITDEICPSLSPEHSLIPSKQIISELSRAAASICALAFGYGSFMIGATCGVIVSLKTQGK